MVELIFKKGKKPLIKEGTKIIWEKKVTDKGTVIKGTFDR